MTTANQVQTKHLPKRKGLDMLKGIAIIGIFLYHLIPSIFPGGFLGVPLFFVLSGYLMFTTSTSYLNTETFPVMDYYKKRTRRIIPPLFIMVMLVCCAMTLMKSRQMIGIREQILSIFLGYNNWWQIEQDASYFSHLTNASPFTHLWFLGVEIQFYLLWPLLFFLYKKLCRHAGAKHACFLFALLAILSFSAMLMLYHPGKDPSRVYYGTDTMGFSLFLGMFLGALRYSFPKLRTSKPAQCEIPILAGMLAVIFLLFLLVSGNAPLLYLGGMFLISIFFAFVILFFENHKALFHDLPLSAQTAWLGKYSYYIYLWHYPVIVLILTGLHN